MLVLPSITAGRGRALLLTIATGLLVGGPVQSINHNTQQIVRSITCMLDKMKQLACRFQVHIKTLLDQYTQVLRQAKESVEAQIEFMKKQVLDGAMEATQKYRDQMEKLQNRVNEIEVR